MLLNFIIQNNEQGGGVNTSVGLLKKIN